MSTRQVTFFSFKKVEVGNGQEMTQSERNYMLFEDEPTVRASRMFCMNRTKVKVNTIGRISPKQC